MFPSLLCDRLLMGLEQVSCKQPLLLWVCGYNSHAMSSRQHITALLPPLVFISPLPSHVCSWDCVPINNKQQTNKQNTRVPRTGECNHLSWALLLGSQDCLFQTVSPNLALHTNPFTQHFKYPVLQPFLRGTVEAGFPLITDGSELLSFSHIGLSSRDLLLTMHSFSLCLIHLEQFLERVYFLPFLSRKTG